MHFHLHPCFAAAVVFVNLPALVQAFTDPDGEVACKISFQPEPPSFTLAGVAFQSEAEARHNFFVTVDDHELQTPPKVLGTYELTEDKVVFRPRFPLSSRVKYRVHVSDSVRKRLASSTPLLFSIAQSHHSEPPKVAGIYPSSQKLPENLLKFYIHFLEPMERGDAYQHIELLKAGEPVEDPFLELGEELWDGNQQRFTLFIHPGRIKRGLKPRQEKGPAIRSGGSYELRIKGSWLSAKGVSLGSTHTKAFQVTPADHEQPKPEAWRIETPQVNSTNTVDLHFNESLDWAMLQRVLTVENAAGEPITGHVIVEQQEKVWRFEPEQAWATGTYLIKVAANLEDNCGNSIARPFEVKMQERAAARPTTTIAIEFVVE